MESEQADAGQGNVHFPCPADHDRIGNLTQLIHPLLYVMTIHTFIHTYINTACVLLFDIKDTHNVEFRFQSESATKMETMPTK